RSESLRQSRPSPPPGESPCGPLPRGRRRSWRWRSGPAYPGSGRRCWPGLVRSECRQSWFFLSAFSTFGDGAEAQAATHAPGAQGVTLIAPLQLVEQGAKDDATGGAQRVAHGNGPTIDVDLVLRHAHVLHELHHH